MTTSELNTLLTGLWAKVKSHVTTAINGLATKSELANFCPIIEDTRTSAVATITGVAPFSELVDGQKIIVKLKYKTSANATLTLTGLTSALPIYARCNTNNNSDITAIYVNGFVAGTFMELIYDAANSRWVCTNYDRVMTYEALTQNRIDTSSSAQCVVTGQLLRSNFYLKSEAMAKRTLVTTGSALTTDTYVDLGTTDTIAPTLPASPSRADEFVFTFTCVSASPNITLPSGVSLADGFDWSEADAGVKFQVSICDGIAAYLVITPNA